MNICKTFGVCVAICLLPLGGCSGSKDSTPMSTTGQSPAAATPRDFDATKKAADSGDAVAQYNLGVMYRDGEGVPQDYAEAMKWFRLAAEQGDTTAKYNLGVMYRDGLGVPQDYAEAVKWSRLAAEQGDAEAQRDLGLMYLSGLGVPQDDAEAYAWISVAATSGSEDASSKRDLVASKLTPEQLSKAQKRATELFEKYGSEN